MVINETQRDIGPTAYKQPTQSFQDDWRAAGCVYVTKWNVRAGNLLRAPSPGGALPSMSHVPCTPVPPRLCTDADVHPCTNTPSLTPTPPSCVSIPALLCPCTPVPLHHCAPHAPFLDACQSLQPTAQMANLSLQVTNGKPAPAGQ